MIKRGGESVFGLGDHSKVKTKKIPHISLMWPLTKGGGDPCLTPLALWAGMQGGGKKVRGRGEEKGSGLAPQARVTLLGIQG